MIFSVDWPIAVALALCAACFAVGLMLSGEGAAWWRGRALRRWVGGLALPGAITGTDGRVGWANGAMQSEFASGSDTPTGALGRGIADLLSLDEGLIYRLATGAREIGFAFQRLEPPERDGEGRILTARYDDTGRLVWMLLPETAPHLPGVPGGLGEAMPDTEDAAGAYPLAESEPSSGSDLETAGPGGRMGPEPNFESGEIGGASPLIPANIGAAAQPVVGQAAGADLDPDPKVWSSSPGGPVAPSSGPIGLDAVPIALLRLDLAGQVQSANEAVRETLGVMPEPGTALAEVLEPLGRPMEALIEDAAANPAGQREMVRLKGRGHSDNFLQISLTPITGAPAPGLLAMLTDASELRQLEDKFAQSQKMEAVGKLAGGVAHDFNNVLTAISGHSDLLLLGKDALHPDYSDLMQIRQNTHRAAALVRQLLAFSRKQTLNPTLLSVQDVVSDTRYLLDRLIGERVNLVMEHGRDLGSVRADHQQLEQALMNLVVNARDAMPQGGTIKIETRNVVVDQPMAVRGVDLRPGNYVEISVGDDGPGIEPGLVDRVFDPFFTTKPVGEGTGLGLSTVYGIVKQSAGYIFAENRPDGGARFRILLPHAREVREGDSLAGGAAPAADSAPDLTGSGTIMLVEDEDPVRAFATRALTLRGYNVVSAASAEEAMDLFREKRAEIDLLVSDVVMPGMDGPTFAAEARKLSPGLKVIFVSGYAEDSFRKNLKDHDFMFLPKPFSLTELTAKVKVALEGGRPERARNGG